MPASATIAVQGDASGFSSLQVPLTITNTSGREIFYNACGGELEQNTATGWQAIWSNVCFTLDVVPFADASNPGSVSGAPLEAGQSASFTFMIPVATQPASDFPQTISGKSGEYRVRIPVFTELAGVVFELPPQRSVSETFLVVGT